MDKLTKPVSYTLTIWITFPFMPGNWKFTMFFRLIIFKSLLSHLSFYFFHSQPACKNHPPPPKKFVLFFISSKPANLQIIPAPLLSLLRRLHTQGAQPNTPPHHNCPRPFPGHPNHAKQKTLSPNSVLQIIALNCWQSWDHNSKEENIELLVVGETNSIRKICNNHKKREHFENIFINFVNLFF